VAMPTVVAAQRFPTRPLRIIVPLPAGATSRINRARTRSSNRRLRYMLRMCNSPGHAPHLLEQCASSKSVGDRFGFREPGG
jgi:hypothetical protein